VNEEAAFRAAIRAEPADDTPRLVFADWLDEHGRPDEAAVERVHAYPDRDDLRLACADALDTVAYLVDAHQPMGHERRWNLQRRAEFIRVQCELAQIAARARTVIFPDGDHAERRYLQRREEELLRADGSAWVAKELPRHADGIVWWIDNILDELAMVTRRVQFRRGFIEVVWAEVSDWVRDGDAIRMMQPISDVHLRDAGRELPAEFWRGEFADNTKVRAMFEEIARRTNPETGTPIHTPHGEALAEVFGRRWPGIKFTLNRFA
jgi:uncharacterized protein (TIGR02996 family)